MTPSRRRYLGALASGVLLAAAFPRIDQGYLAWVGMVPLLLAVRGLAPRQAAGFGWITGFVFFAITISWVPDTISNFTSIPPVVATLVLMIMAAACAYTFALFAYVLELLAAGRVSRVLAAPVLWAVLEWMRTFVVAEFPWNLLGYSQVPYLALTQAADLGGVYLISAVIVLANAAITEGLAARSSADGRSSAARFALAATCPVLLLSYGTWRLSALHTIPYTGSVKIGITQGNIPQNAKWDAAWAAHIFETYLRLTEQAAAAGAQLVVWPEAALPFYIQRDMRSQQLQSLARDKGIDILVGAPGLENRDGLGDRDYSQAWLLRADGTVVGPYDKMQLVPFGEYIPLGGLFGLVQIIVEGIGEMGRGSDYTIFQSMNLTPLEGAAAEAARPARFAALICYEGIFPKLVRTFAAKDADFLVNISNDAWYGDTSAAEQHLIMASMRAIENRLPLVRSTNTGISAFVTDEGKIGPTTPLFHEDMVVETVLVRDVWSLYREYGDLFLHGCQAALVALLLIARRSRGTLRASWQK